MLAGVDVSAQTPGNGTTEDTEDRALDPAQPDFTVVNLPTTLRLPRFGSAFRVTHRFVRPFTRGRFGQVADDLFGIDSGAMIGLEYRFGLMRGLQAGLYRTSDKTIQFFGQYDLLRQARGFPATIDVVASIEGLNNFHRGDRVAHEDNEYAPAVGLVMSRVVGDRAAFYVQPEWIRHANVLSSGRPDVNTFLLGLSARIRIRPSVYLAGSVAPRWGQNHPNVALKTFAIEKRTGGHAFQLNVSNSLGATLAQIARGATNNSDWFLGFNISRRFF
jgi:hypothetical protein